MKANIKIVTLGKFTPKQLDVMRRVQDVLTANGLLVKVEIKTKVITTLKKAV